MAHAPISHFHKWLMIILAVAAAGFIYIITLDTIDYVAGVGDENYVGKLATHFRKPANIDTSAWLTYQARNIDYSVKYPADWQYKPLVPDGAIFSPKGSPVTSNYAAVQCSNYTEADYEEMLSSSTKRQRRATLAGYKGISGYITDTNNQKQNVFIMKTTPAGETSTSPTVLCHMTFKGDDISRAIVSTFILVGRTTNTTEAPGVKPTSKLPSITSPSFMYQKGKNIVVHNLQSSKTTNFQFEPKPFLISGDLNSANAVQNVQFSKDGQVMAYHVGQEDGMGESAPPNTYKLYVNYGTNSDKVIENVDIQDVVYWLLNPNGKTIYYTFNLNNNTKKASKFALYSYDIITKTKTKLADLPATFKTTQWWAQFDSISNAIYLYVDNKDKANKYTLNLIKYDLTLSKLTSSQIFTADSPQTADYDVMDNAISPGGEYVALRVGDWVNSTGGVEIYNLKTKNLVSIFKSAKYRSVNTIVWSPDGKKIAFHETHFGGGDNAIELKLYCFDVSTKSKVTIASGVTDFLGNFTFSPDGRYLGYEYRKYLYVYDFTTKKSQKLSNDKSDANNMTFAAWAGF